MRLRSGKLLIFCLMACASLMLDAQKKPSPKPKPECSDGSAYGSIGVVYSCEGGKWVLNTEATEAATEAMEAAGKAEAHRQDLFWALRSRILTDKEMAEVAAYGDQLNIQPDVSWFPEEKSRELNDALLQQFKLRAAAERPCAK